MPRIYADNAATTKISQTAMKAMISAMENSYGNPSSIHQIGMAANDALQTAREQIARCLGCMPKEIFFTSGGTESDNQAIVSAAMLGAKKNKRHIISTAFEHHAVLHTLRRLKEQGFEIQLLDVGAEGNITAAQVEEAIRPDTCLVTVMFANNEIGSVLPIAEIGEACRAHGVLFHTDAVQAFGHIEIDVKKIGADMLSASSHKFHGPKGCGFLYADKNTGIKPFIYGGGQERGQRSGTENVPGILGMVKAAEISHRIMDENNRKLRKINDYMTDRILNEIDDCICNGNRENRLSNNINVSFSNIDGKALLVLLDMEGVYVSGASACNGGKEKSYVLSSLGVPEKYADGTIRMTMDYTMNMKQADYVLNVLKKCVNYLRKK